MRGRDVLAPLHKGFVDADRDFKNFTIQQLVAAALLAPFLAALLPTLTEHADLPRPVPLPTNLRARLPGGLPPTG